MCSLLSVFVSWIVIEFMLFVLLMISIDLLVFVFCGDMCNWLNSVFYVVSVVSGSVVVVVKLSVCGFSVVICLLIVWNLLFVLGCVMLFV